MDMARWPTLTHEYPLHPAKHATTLKADFKAVRRYLSKTGAAAVPKYLFKLLHSSYTELSQKLLARPSIEQSIDDTSFESATDSVERAMRQAATASISKHTATIEDQFRTIQQFLHTTRAKGVPRHLFEILFRSVAGLREELKTQIFTEDPIRGPTGQHCQVNTKGLRIEQAVEPSDGPVEGSPKANSRLLSEELGGASSEQGKKGQRSPVTPTQKSMRLAMETIANSSVGELVVPDSDPGRFQNATMTRQPARWPHEYDETDDIDEGKSVDVQSEDQSSLMQNHAAHRSGKKAPLRFLTDVHAESSFDSGKARNEVTPQFRLARDYPEAQESQKEISDERDKMSDGEVDIPDKQSGKEDHEGTSSEEKGSGHEDEGEVDNDEIVVQKEIIEKSHAKDVKVEETDSEPNLNMATARLRDPSTLRSPMPTNDQTSFHVQDTFVRSFRYPSPNGFASTAPGKCHSGVANVDIPVVVPNHFNGSANPSGWIRKFENRPPGTFKTYKVMMCNVPTHSLDLSSAKKKIEAALSLAARNATTISSPDAIRYLRWFGNRLTPDLAFESVFIEFATAEQANLAIRLGLLWNGTVHSCRKPAKNVKIPRCGRCQSYSHNQSQCTFALRCGICAGIHWTRRCVSNVPKCVLCSGPHPSHHESCQVRQAEQERFDVDSHLCDPFYRIIEDSERATKTASLPEDSSALRPSWIATVNGGDMHGNQVQGSSSARTERKRSSHVPPIQVIKVVGTSPPHIDPESILEQLENLKAVVAGLFPLTKASATMGSTRKRRVLNPMSKNADISTRAGKRVKREDSSAV